MRRGKVNIILTLLFLFACIISKAQIPCIFTNNGGDNLWSTGSNWTCGSAPTETTSYITIPAGAVVDYDLNGNFDFTGISIDLQGSLDMGTDHLHMQNTSVLTIGSSATINAEDLKAEDDAVITIDYGATVTLEELKTKNNGVITINADCIDVYTKIENKDASEITGSGCINFTGTDYKNTGTGGIFNCTSNTQTDCFGGGGGTGDCEFTDNAAGNSNWNDADNWSCGNVPDPSVDNVIIPTGFTVNYDLGADLNFTNSTTFTLNGTIDFGTKKLKMKNTTTLTIGATGVLTTKQLKFENSATGTIEDNATVTVEELETKGTTVLTINANCVTVTNKLKNKESATINGTGCIDHTGTEFENGGTGGIFGCFVTTSLDDCDLDPDADDDCTFTDNAVGNSDWSDADNWSCGNVPDPSVDNVVIPSGFIVNYDLGVDLNFTNSTTFTLHGEIDLGTKKLKMKNTSTLVMGATAVFAAKQLKLENSAVGIIAEGASVDLEELETKGTTVLTIGANCIAVTSKLKNKESATIAGDGCIDYTGTQFENGGTGGIFNCFESTWDACDFDPVTLPVEMGEFSINIKHDLINLSWNTYSEINNSHFEVQMSTDEIGFHSIASIPGKGNSDNLTQYNYSFSPEKQGVIYLKIKQVDFDGQFAETQILSVFYEEESISNKISFHPNPSSENIHFTGFQAQTNYQLNIYSFNGDFIQSANITDNTFNTSHLNNGSYTIQIQNQTSTPTVLKLVKI